MPFGVPQGPTASRDLPPLAGLGMRAFAYASKQQLTLFHVFYAQYQYLA
jgi:hypothetical protein